MKSASLFAALALCLTLAPLPALAHKVIASVYPAGARIEGEIGFSNGDMAVQTRVTVTDPSGRPLGETMTDAAGGFAFTPTEPVDHLFRADLGAGHVAQATLSAAEVAAILGKAAAKPAAPAPAPAAAAGATASAPTAAPAPIDPEVIAAALRDEIRPLRQEIAAYKEKNTLQTILGGIGYIAGLFGLGFYLAARRRLMAG